VGRTLLSDAFDLDFDFAEDEPDARSTVEQQTRAVTWKSGASAPRKDREGHEFTRAAQKPQKKEPAFSR
jgi:hypothetical protein